MRVRNKARVPVLYQFAGLHGAKRLIPGQLSPWLPATRFYDPRLQHALEKGIIEVEFDEKDVGIVGVAGLPGPVARVLGALKPEPPPSYSVVTKPVAVVSAPFEAKRRKKARPDKGLVNRPAPGPMRAKDLARKLGIAFNVLASFLEKKTDKRVYPLNIVTEEMVKLAEEEYGVKLELPEIREVRKAEPAKAMSLSELSHGSDGVIKLSLADLVHENEMRRAGSDG